MHTTSGVIFSADVWVSGGQVIFQYKPGSKNTQKEQQCIFKRIIFIYDVIYRFISTLLNTDYILLLLNEIS